VGLVAFGFGLTMFDSTRPFELILYSAGLGILLYVAAMIGYLVSAYLVARLAGHPTSYEHLARKDDRPTASILLAAGVWMLGQTWVDQKVETIIACVDEEAFEEVFTPRATLGEIVDWCATDYGDVDQADYES
jgi:hypothetical protein